eukprot:3596044-Amphidinium_carterae.2
MCAATSLCEMCSTQNATTSPFLYDMVPRLATCAKVVFISARNSATASCLSSMQIMRMMTTLQHGSRLRGQHIVKQ